jgi:hypothetical protein
MAVKDVTELTVYKEWVSGNNEVGRMLGAMINNPDKYC